MGGSIFPQKSSTQVSPELRCINLNLYSAIHFLVLEFLCLVWGVKFREPIRFQLSILLIKSPGIPSSNPDRVDIQEKLEILVL